MGKTLGNGRYLKEAKLGEGTFGAVYKAQDTQTGEYVAVKQIYINESDRGRGVNVTALREIKLLKELHHENIIRLVDVFAHKGNLNLVFDLMDTDLEAIIRDQTVVLSQGDIKAYMQMTLKALAFCHSKWVLHRDMKPNNLFLSSSGVLKLGDFGLARIFGSPNPRLTHEVFATWYRAPELLFGCKAYGSAVDMWGAGCVFAELLLRSVFLPGESVLDQLGKIFAKFGTPQESDWPGVTCLPDYVEFYPSPLKPLKASFPNASDDALDLLAKMFTLDPNKRITAKQALEHRYFTCAPLPTDPRALPRPMKNREQAKFAPMAKSRTSQLSPSSDGEADEPPRHKSRHENKGADTGTGTGTGTGQKMGTPMVSGSSGAPMSVDTGAQGTKPGGLPPRPSPNSSGSKPLKRKLNDMFS